MMKNVVDKFCFEDGRWCVFLWQRSFAILTLDSGIGIPLIVESYGIYKWIYERCARWS